MMGYYIEIVLRVLFGFQFFFWGLNGFFHWMKIPPSGEVIEGFVAACERTRFIMPTVKILEIILGLFLIFGFMIPTSLLLLGPIIFVITGLHLLHNSKPGFVIATCSVPYIVLLCIHSPTWLRLFH